MRLDRLVADLLAKGSRTKASELIQAGKVKVNGQLQTRPSYSVKDNDKIELLESPKYVSRGGEKLSSVAEKLGVKFSGKVVADIGSSTGGFTDYALQQNAQKIYAIDVGTNQLDPRIRADSRVVSMEKTDVRELNKLPDAIDIFVIDVSFISLRLILPSIKQLASKNSLVIAMAKPHFEAGEVSAKHKGVIKNDTVRRKILKQVEQYMKKDFVVLDKADSGVAGRKGNLERFYLLKPLV